MVSNIDFLTVINSWNIPNQALKPTLFAIIATIYNKEPFWHSSIFLTSKNNMTLNYF